MLLKLKVVAGSNSGKEIVINKDKFLIGRADDCNLRPHSDAISRRHCVIIKTDKAVGVRDLKSRNGTLVNGEKITGDKRLRDGDTLEVGPLKFEVSLQKQSVAKPATAPKAQPTTEKGAIGGMVSQWLEEADDVAHEEQRLSGMETREYRFDDTSQITVEDDKPSDDETKAEKVVADDKKKEKKEPGKLPKFHVKTEQPKDTHEAASQVLRKLFNRS